MAAQCSEDPQARSTGAQGPRDPDRSRCLRAITPHDRAGAGGGWSGGCRPFVPRPNAEEKRETPSVMHQPRSRTLSGMRRPRGGGGSDGKATEFTCSWCGAGGHVCPGASGLDRGTRTLRHRRDRGDRRDRPGKIGLAISTETDEPFRAAPASVRMTMARRAVQTVSLVLIVLTAGCYDASSVLDRTSDDAAVLDGDDAWRAPMVAVCGGVTCADGEVCCLVDLRCVAPGDPSCVPPPGSPPGACASSADCSLGESCEAATSTGGLAGSQCAGAGVCMPIRNGCGGTGGDVCGCDGRTYASECAASAARVRIAGLAPCGTPVNPRSTTSCASDAECRHGHCDLSVNACIGEDPLITCGLDEQCPSGQSCCLLTGLCAPPSEAALCVLPPEGTSLACFSDRECARFDGSWWGGGNRGVFCDGDTCDGPGGCRMPPSSCEGTILPVCGCDGSTYQNDCEADRSGVRVAHAGAC
jgi:hypothetical protein